MDRSLKWRTLVLLAAIIGCVLVLAPSIDDETLPSWYPSHKKISLGLDLQGGTHVVYGIDLNQAVDDKAFEIRRDVDSWLHEKNIKATIKTPPILGALTVEVEDASKRAQVVQYIQADFAESTVSRACEAGAKPDAICIRVSSEYADGIKKSAIANAVAVIRERIDKSGVAEPTVIEKGDQIIVEIPGPPDDKKTRDTLEQIKRTAKLEFKVVDNGSEFMHSIWLHVGEGQEDELGHPIATDPEAKRLGIHAKLEQFRGEKEGQEFIDYYLYAHDRKQQVPKAWADKNGCHTDAKNYDSSAPQQECTVFGWQIIQAYLQGDELLGIKGLEATDPKFKIPDDREIRYELEEPYDQAKDQRQRWRSYYLDRVVQLTGSAIKEAAPSYDPNTNRPVVSIEFNRYGTRVFGDLTEKIVGKKLAAILDGDVRSAPTINEPIRGGRAQISLGGGGDIQRSEREQTALVNVLKTGSLPAPLQVETQSEIGPTLGQDAIDKTKVSFLLGVLLVIVIMVGVYKWSGWVAVFAVMFHVLVTLAVMALFGATLTLPGIAALVLSVGMCVDGNILINERIRDELLLGKSVRGAVDLGFSRAFSAILDGQLTIAASAWVLLNYGSGPIKGFAVMMLVGVFTTIATNTWVTRILFDWSVARKKGATTLSI
ncbi:MAG: protein translocase subunit SecD [Kofleriaceae bacterium]